MVLRFFYLVFCGLLLGFGVFAPGFSSSILAITMGIYQDLLRIAANPFRLTKNELLFCAPLVIGMILGVILFVFAFKFMFESHERAAYLLFAGLIAGNLPIIFNQIKKGGFKIRFFIGGSTAFIGTLVLVFFSMGVFGAPATGDMPLGLSVMALTGFIGGAITPIPGITISTIFIATGQYGQLVSAAESLLRMDFTYLLPFGLLGICAIIGLMLTSRGIKIVFEKFPGLANSIVLGFMTGSLVGILIHAQRSDGTNFRWIPGIIVLMAGFGITMLFDMFKKAVDKR